MNSSISTLSRRDSLISLRHRSSTPYEGIVKGSWLPFIWRNTSYKGRSRTHSHWSSVSPRMNGSSSTYLVCTSLPNLHMTDRDGSTNLCASIATLDVHSSRRSRTRQKFVITYGLNSRCRSYEEKSEIHERNRNKEITRSVFWSIWV